MASNGGGTQIVNETQENPTTPPPPPPTNTTTTTTTTTTPTQFETREFVVVDPRNFQSPVQEAGVQDIEDQDDEDSGEEESDRDQQEDDEERGLVEQFKNIERESNSMDANIQNCQQEINMAVTALQELRNVS